MARILIVEDNPDLLQVLRELLGKEHDVLTLREIPAAAASLGAADDPQATRETIGGRDVTIIRRGNGCVSAEWVQDGVALTLTNPYDPPGEPGEVRYTCDQLRRIIESIE